VFGFGIKDSQNRDEIYLQAEILSKVARTFYTIGWHNHYPERPLAHNNRKSYANAQARIKVLTLTND